MSLQICTIVMYTRRGREERCLHIRWLAFLDFRILGASEAEASDRVMLGLGPPFDLVIFAIQETQLPTLEEPWQEKEASWNT